MSAQNILVQNEAKNLQGSLTSHHAETVIQYGCNFVFQGVIFLSVLTLFPLSSQVKESCAFMGHCSMKQRFVFPHYFCVISRLLTLIHTTTNVLHRPVCPLALQCVKINIKDKQIKYFIHYSGWNKK